jgi:hypothetical protein
MAKSVLKPKGQSSTKTVSFRIGVDLADEIDAVKADADARGLVFDTAAIVEKALASAVKVAREELGQPASA